MYKYACYFYDFRTVFNILFVLSMFFTQFRVFTRNLNIKYPQRSVKYLWLWSYIIFQDVYTISECIHSPHIYHKITIKWKLLLSITVLFNQPFICISFLEHGSGKNVSVTSFLTNFVLYDNKRLLLFCDIFVIS